MVDTAQKSRETSPTVTAFSDHVWEMEGMVALSNGI